MKIIHHFIDSARFGLSHDIVRPTDNKKNVCEKLGDAGLWATETFPGKVWNVISDPRVVSVALCALALGGISYLFYPSLTMNTANSLLGRITLPTSEQLKLALTVVLSINIVAATLRALGRFTNAELVAAWKNPVAVI